MEHLNFNALVESMPHPLIVLDLQDNLIYINQYARKYEGLARNPMQIGASVHDLVAQDRRETIRQLLHRVKTVKTTQFSEGEYQDSLGKVYYFEICYYPIFNHQMVLERISVLFRDITHEKAFQKRASQLLQEFTALIENANAVIFSIDSRGYLTEWNRECVRITNFTKNAVLAKKVQEFVDESYREGFSSYLLRILSKDTEGTFELLLKTQDANKVHLLVNATAKVNNHGDVVGVLFVGQDITELHTYRTSLEEMVKDRTEKLQQALRKESELVDIKNRFVSIASHEFRIPLSNISSSVTVIKSEGKLSAKQMEKLFNIEKQIEHMRALMEDVLTLGKTEFTKIMANEGSIELIGVLKKLITEVENVHETHKIIFDSSHNIIEFESDEKLLRNIFLNLLSNAIKYSPGANEVFLSVQKEKNNIEVKIRDKGIGITNDDGLKIFEPFSRGSNAAGMKGTGLGLSIVKKAIDALQGDVEFISSPGNGTTFIVKLAYVKLKKV